MFPVTAFDCAQYIHICLTRLCSAAPLGAKSLIRRNAVPVPFLRVFSINHLFLSLSLFPGQLLIVVRLPLRPERLWARTTWWADLGADASLGFCFHVTSELPAGEEECWVGRRGLTSIPKTLGALGKSLVWRFVLGSDACDALRQVRNWAFRFKKILFLRKGWTRRPERVIPVTHHRYILSTNFTDLSF